MRRRARRRRSDPVRRPSERLKGGACTHRWRVEPALPMDGGWNPPHDAIRQPDAVGRLRRPRMHAIGGRSRPPDSRGGRRPYFDAPATAGTPATGGTPATWGTHRPRRAHRPCGRIGPARGDPKRPSPARMTPWFRDRRHRAQRRRGIVQRERSSSRRRRQRSARTERFANLECRTSPCLAFTAASGTARRPSRECAKYGRCSGTGSPLTRCDACLEKVGKTRVAPQRRRPCHRPA